MSLVGDFPIGIVIHFRNDHPGPVALALQHPQREVVSLVDRSTADKLLALDY